MPGAGADERAWVRGAQAGSVSDLEALFSEHWPRAYRAAYLVVHDAAAAEDIAQEAFLAALRALDRFDRRSPTWRRCARCRALTSAARCGRGFTGSSSTARSTGRARGLCAERSGTTPSLRPRRVLIDRDAFSRKVWSRRSRICHPSTAA